GVSHYVAWTPGRESRADWRRWAGVERQDDSPPAAELPPVPVSLLRRVSALGQQALKAAWGLPALHQSRFVFASRHGEFDRTLGILQSLAQREPPSPADFSLSVHNALAGLLSIAT